MTYIVNDAKHWRDRANEARLLAEQLTDAAARASMLATADAYDKMAERAESAVIVKVPLADVFAAGK